MHLANIDCGRIYIFCVHKVLKERQLSFSPHLNSANTHNIIVISAGASAVIENGWLMIRYYHHMKDGDF